MSMRKWSINSRLVKVGKVFWATVEWDGYDANSGGSFSFPRPDIESLILSIEDYIDHWKGMSAYLSCASVETRTSYKDLTDAVKVKLQKRK